MRLQEKAERLKDQFFLGGPPVSFERAGRMQLMMLLKEGLEPDSRVLDIGCGSLRGGYWLIHFLRPGRYFGLEPNTQMLDAGIGAFLEPGLLEEKKPRFHNNAEFDFSVFGETFDFMIARSIWSHASKGQILKMLDGFARHSHSGGVFLTSYFRPDASVPDYGGTEWVGISHESSRSGVVAHAFEWIARACRQRGLDVREIDEKAFNFGRQIWLRIGKP